MKNKLNVIWYPSTDSTRKFQYMLCCTRPSLTDFKFRIELKTVNVVIGQKIGILLPWGGAPAMHRYYQDDDGALWLSFEWFDFMSCAALPFNSYPSPKMQTCEISDPDQLQNSKSELSIWKRRSYHLVAASPQAFDWFNCVVDCNLVRFSDPPYF